MLTILSTPVTKKAKLCFLCLVALNPGTELQQQSQTTFLSYNSASLLAACVGQQPSFLASPGPLVGGIY